MIQPRALLLALLALVAATSVRAQVYHDSGDPTPGEQEVLVLLNRARANPAAEGQRVAAYMRAQGIGLDAAGHPPDQVAADFAAYPAQPPLAMSAQLLAAARAQAADNAARRALSHVGSDGSIAPDRVKAAGYPGFCTAEDVLNRADPETIHYRLLVDVGEMGSDPTLSNRVNRLDLEFQVEAEIGVGIVALDGGAGGDGYVTEDYGVSLRDQSAFLVGMVTDQEGAPLGGVTLSVENGGACTGSGSAGGYALPLVRADGSAVDGLVAVRVEGLPGGGRRYVVNVARRQPTAGTNYARYGGPYRANVALDIQVGDGGGRTLAFFAGETALANGVYYLQFPGGNPFGYYSYLSDPRYLFHQDLGFEYVFDANDGKGGVYLYDFASKGFFYTAPGFPFPYLYDFSLNTVIYYFPDPSNPGRYNTNGTRFFVRLDTGAIISK